MARARALFRRTTIASFAIALASACTSADSAADIDLTSEPPPDESSFVRPIPIDATFDPARAGLGERLFADPRLSEDGTVACTSCHDLADGGDAGNEVTELPGRTRGTINVPGIFNLRYQFRWSWTGRWTVMSDQIDAAMRAPHSLHTEPADAVERIRAAYARDFDRVYPGTGLNLDTFHDAVTEYLSSLTTPNAPFDRFLRGETSALSGDARAGWELFQSLGCVSCHQGINIGGNMFQRFGVMDDYFAPPREPLPSDAGREAITHDPRDLHVFRVPSLRNVALTAPYFHDGRTATLPEAVRVMARYQLGRTIAPAEVDQLVAFLESLTGDRP
jgi:cytochrome c peroxidase